MSFLPLYLLLVCSNSPEFLCIPAPVAECCRRWHFPELQLSGQALCVATTMQDYLNIELNICVPREIRTVRDELCTSVLLQDTLLRNLDPTLFATFCRVSFSSAGAAVLSPRLHSTSGKSPVLFPWLMFC